MAERRVVDCVVVGGGIIGLLTARELHQAGLSVCLVERGAAARESSWAGGGILSPLYPWRNPDPLNELVRWSQAHYPSLIDACRRDADSDPEFIRCGMLILDTEEQDAATNWGERFGATVETLDGAALQDREPALAADVKAALSLPDVAQVRTPRLGRAVRANLLANGVTMEEHNAVTAIRLAGGRVSGVQTDNGLIDAGHIVVAAGAWSAALLAPLDIELPVIPVRGQMILLKARPGLVRHIVLRSGRYLIPRRDGRLLVGSTMEEAGFDKGITREARQKLHSAATALVGELAEAPVEHQWAGLRPGSPQGMPYISEAIENSGLWVNTGHHRNGVVMAPAAARLLADQLLGRPGFMEPSPFAISGGVDRVKGVV